MQMADGGGVDNSRKRGRRRRLEWRWSRWRKKRRLECRMQMREAMRHISQNQCLRISLFFRVLEKDDETSVCPLLEPYPHSVARNVKVRFVGADENFGAEGWHVAGVAPIRRGRFINFSSAPTKDPRAALFLRVS